MKELKEITMKRLHNKDVNVKKTLQKKILEANISVHKKEAQYYDLLHLELYNKHEQTRLRNGIRNVVNSIRSSKIEVLDVGSGTGNLVSLLLSLTVNKQIKVTAVDISEEMQKEMQHKLKIDNITYQTKDIDTFLKTNKTKFDLVMISSVLHHLPDYIKTLNTLVKHLRKGGMIYATHEPLKNNERSSSLLYKMSNLADRLLFAARFGILRLLGRVPRSGINYADADYHTKEGGLSVAFIKERINCSKMEVKKYSVNYYTAALSNNLHYYNCFEMTIHA